MAARGMVLGSRNAVPAQGSDSDNVAVFPMGFSFLAGPGTIVTTILLMQSRGHVITAVAAVAVYLTILPLLFLAPFIQRAIGKVGVMVISRILYIFIAAKAVAFILTGLRASFALPA